MAYSKEDVLKEAKQYEGQNKVIVNRVAFEYPNEKSKKKYWYVYHTCPGGCGEETGTTLVAFRKGNGLNCKECGCKIAAEKQTYSQEDVLKEAKSYEEQNKVKVSKVVLEYTSKKSKEKRWYIYHTCPGGCGKEVRTQLDDFKKGNGLNCKECGYKIQAKKHIKPYEDVKKDIEKVGCELLTRKEDYINRKQKLLIKCSCCNNVYFCSYNSFMYYKIYRCKACSKAESYGELVVRTFLEKNNIPFKTQLDTLKCINPSSNKQLPYDFEIVDKKIIIEVQGIDHYIDTRRKGKKFLKYRQELDKIKKEYAISQGYKVVYINHFLEIEVEGQKDNIKNKTYQKIIMNVLGITNWTDITEDDIINNRRLEPTIFGIPVDGDRVVEFSSQGEAARWLGGKARQSAIGSCINADTQIAKRGNTCWRNKQAYNYYWYRILDIEDLFFTESTLEEKEAILKIRRKMDRYKYVEE